MTNKRDRDPWNDRYDRDDDDAENAESAETSEASKRSKMSETAESTKTSEETKTSETKTVRDRKNVNMYLPEDLVGDLQLRYSELNVEWRRRYDGDLPKNQEFYPAVIQAALGESSIEEELGLNDE